MLYNSFCVRPYPFWLKLGSSFCTVPIYRISLRALMVRSWLRNDTEKISVDKTKNDTHKSARNSWINTEKIRMDSNFDVCVAKELIKEVVMAGGSIQVVAATACALWQVCTRSANPGDNMGSNKKSLDLPQVTIQEVPVPQIQIVEDDIEEPPPLFACQSFFISEEVVKEEVVMPIREDVREIPLQSIPQLQMPQSTDQEVQEVPVPIIETITKVPQPQSIEKIVQEPQIPVQELVKEKFTVEKIVQEPQISGPDFETQMLNALESQRLKIDELIKINQRTSDGMT